VTAPEGAAQTVSGFLEREASEGRLTLVGRSERAWDILVPSYWKEAVPVSIEVRERTVRAEAFFMRAPQENADRVYKLLLERNLGSRLWRFASNEAGDVSLVAELPLGGVSDEELDQLIGGLFVLTDETYKPYFQLAFETALAEQVAAGGPGLDQPPPWAKDWDSPKPPAA
jgi:hypothetical protein